MKKKRYIFPILIVILLLLSGCEEHKLQSGDIKRGVLDLSGPDLNENDIIRLDGDWEFYSDRLIDPGKFDDSANLTGYYAVPEYWTKYEGLNLSSKGYATYRLIVNTNGDDHNLSIKFPEIYTEYCIWINGEILESNGSFADEPTRYLFPKVYDFTVSGGEIEIVLQINNSAHSNAGIGQSILLGTTESIHRESNIEAAIDISLIAFCFFAGIFHLIYYAFRKNDIELLYFCVLCIANSVRTLFSNTTLVMYVFPEIPFLLGSKIVTLTVPIIVISALLYTYALFQRDISKRFLYPLVCVSGLYALLVLAGSSMVYSSAFNIYLVTLFADFLFAIYVSVVSVLKRRGTAFFYIIGCTFLIFGGLVDIFAYQQVIYSRYVLSASFCVFIIAMTALLAKRYSDAYREVAELSENLETSRNKIVSTETAFLNAQMKPHFIYNALNTIAECCATDPDEAEELILSLSMYLRGTLDFENLGGSIPLKKEIELVRAYVSIEEARFENIRVEFVIDDGLSAVQIPPLILQPLVENSIKHGIREKESGGAIAVRIKAEHDHVLFEVEDNGIGMAKGKFDALLAVPDSSSVGLYNINARLIRFCGKGISIKSAVNTGTVIRFEIPLKESG